MGAGFREVSPNSLGTLRERRPALLEFPHGGGDWQISHPVDWTAHEDPDHADTYVFGSRDERIRLLITRRVLTLELSGSDPDLETRNLDVGRRLALEMACAARAPEPALVPFTNPTCHGFHYRVEVTKPRSESLPHLLGFSAVHSRFHLMGYFEFADSPEQVECFILRAIGSISCGPPAPPARPRTGKAASPRKKTRKASRRRH